MRLYKLLGPLCLGLCSAAAQGTLLYYQVPGATATGVTDLYTIDTATGAQARAMTVDGNLYGGLASSPVANALYAGEIVQQTLGENYQCVHLVDVALHHQRLVGCSRTYSSHLTFDARHDILYSGTSGLSIIGQRTAKPGPRKGFGIGLLRQQQGMAIAYDVTSDTLFGSGVFAADRGFYTIDPATGVPTKRGTTAYRALFVDPSSGTLFGIAPDSGTPGTPELQVVDKSTGIGTRLWTLPDGATSLAAPAAMSSTITLAEYHHAAFDHYFVTGDPSEIAKLDSGSIAGWLRTGELFAAFPLDSPGTANTCRFFSTAFAPKSSHFFAADAHECAVVKDNPAWLFEGEVFAQIPAPPDGDCAFGLLPLYRVYNDGQGGAPAHRLAARDAVRSEQVQRGWIPEGAGAGVVACVVPAIAPSDSAEGVWIGTSRNPVGGPIVAYEAVQTVVLDTGAFYQLYFDYQTTGRPIVGAVVKGIASASPGTLTSTSATDFRFPNNYFGGATGTATGTTLNADYVSESGLSGRAAPEAAFGSAYQTGYRTPADLAAVVGTYRGRLGSMQVGSGLGDDLVLVVGSDGAVSGAFGPCVLQGTLAPHGGVNVFDFTVSFSGSTCPSSTSPLRGIAYFDAAKQALTAIAANESHTDAFGFLGSKP